MLHYIKYSNKWIRNCKVTQEFLALRKDKGLTDFVHFGHAVVSKKIKPKSLKRLLNKLIVLDKFPEFTEGEMLCVKNKIAKKQVLPGDNSSIGLTNIKARYQMLSDIPVEIIKGEEFIVKLPLLTVV